MRSLFFAGLRSEWREATGAPPVRSFTIVTTEPNDLLAGIGHDRMPCILDGPAARAWLADADEAQALLDLIRPPRPATDMEAYPIGYDVNYRDRNGLEVVRAIPIWT